MSVFLCGILNSPLMKNLIRSADFLRPYVWQVLVSLIAMPPGAISFCRNVGHIGLLLALGFAAMRMIDTGVEHVQRHSADQRFAGSLLPLARRLVKLALGAMVGVMVLARMGYAVGPLLVLLAIVGGGIALAARRPVENVLAAYALMGDHGLREGDCVTLDHGVGPVRFAVPPPFANDFHELLSP